jgi:transcriptional regulator with XRE-family HTH domain
MRNAAAIEIGENIKSARSNARLTREHLAVALGVTVSTIYRWESGSTAPSVGRLHKIAVELDVPLSSLWPNGEAVA